MSYREQWHSLPYHPSWVLEAHHLYGLSTPSSCSCCWLLLADQWEGFTQASQLQGLAVITDHQPLPSMEDQLCRGRVVVPQHCLWVSTGCVGPGVSQVVQTKVSPHLCFAWGTLPEL